VKADEKQPKISDYYSSSASKSMPSSQENISDVLKSEDKAVLSEIESKSISIESDSDSEFQVKESKVSVVRRSPR
jgi:hypothetical protein